MPHLEELEDEYDTMSKLDHIINEPVVKTVEEEYQVKFVFDGAEKLFLSNKVHINTENIKPMLQPIMNNTEPMFGTTQGESTTNMEHQ